MTKKWDGSYGYSIKVLDYARELTARAVDQPMLDQLRSCKGIRALEFSGGKAELNLEPITALADSLIGLEIENARLAGLEPLRRLERLEILKLRKCGCRDLAPLRGLGKLAILDLRHNGLTMFPADLQLPEMSILSLEGNRLPDVGYASRMPELTDLSVDGRALDDLSPLLACPRLQTLTLEGKDTYSFAHLPIVDRVYVLSGRTIPPRDDLELFSWNPEASFLVSDGLAPASSRPRGSVMPGTGAHTTMVELLSRLRPATQWRPVPATQDGDAMVLSWGRNKLLVGPASLTLAGSYGAYTTPVPDIAWKALRAATEDPAVLDGGKAHQLLERQPERMEIQQRVERGQRVERLLAKLQANDEAALHGCTDLELLRYTLFHACDREIHLPWLAEHIVGHPDREIALECVDLLLSCIGTRAAAAAVTGFVAAEDRAGDLIHDALVANYRKEDLVYGADTFHVAHMHGVDFLEQVAGPRHAKLFEWYLERRDCFADEHLRFYKRLVKVADKTRSASLVTPLIDLLTVDRRIVDGEKVLKKLCLQALARLGSAEDIPRIEAQIDRAKEPADVLDALDKAVKQLTKRGRPTGQ